MRTLVSRCNEGCHRQAGVILGPVQAEVSYEADRVRIGARLELHKGSGALAVTVFFGPFQLAVGLRYRP